MVRDQVPAAARPAPAQAAPQVPAVYLPPFYHAERSLARALLRLHAARADRLAGFAAVDWDKAFAWLRTRTGSELAPEQADAVRLALTAKVAVLTGGPGCGKSFTVRSVVELARAKGATIVLAAPTGRAAKRLAELAGHDAATIHRLLALRPGGDPSFDAGKPLDADLVVVDETSMVDVILANKLVKAVPPGAHLLLVGDAGPAALGRRRGGAPRPARRRVAARGPADQDLPPGPAVRHRDQRPPDQRRAAAADRVRRLLLVRLRGHRADRRARHRHRGAADPGPVRPGPAPRRPGAVPDAPRPGRRREPQPAAAGGADPVPRRRAGTPLRRPGVPGRGQGHPAAQQLRQGHRRRVQRHRRRRHRHVPRGAHPDRAHRRRRARRLRLRRARTSWTAPTRSPSTGPRAANTPPSSSRSPPAPG